MIGQNHHDKLLSDAISVTNKQLDSIKLDDFIIFQTSEDEYGNIWIPGTIVRALCYRITRIERGYYRSKHDYRLPSLIGADIISNASVELIRLRHTTVVANDGGFFSDNRFDVPYFENFTYYKGQKSGRWIVKKDYYVTQSGSFRIPDNVEKVQILQRIYMDQQLEKENQLRKQNEIVQRAQENASLESEVESMLRKIHNNR